MISCRIHEYTALGYFCGLQTTFAAVKLIEKVTEIRYTPLLNPSVSDPVMREYADVPKKHKVIVTGRHPDIFFMLP